MNVFHRSHWLAALLACSSWALACDPFETEVSRYDIERGSTRLGTGEIRLREAQAPGCYVLEQTAIPHFMLRWLSGPAIQSSEFCVQPDGSLRSYGYSQQRTGIGAEKENYSLQFDWANGLVRGGRFGEAQLEPQQTDQLLLATRVRQWLCQRQDAPDPSALSSTLRLDYVDQRGADAYEVAVRERERISVPAGEYEAVLVERIDADDRVSRFWLDPQQNFRLLRAEQKKRDDPVIRLSLNTDPTRTAR